MKRLNVEATITVHVLSDGRGVVIEADHISTDLLLLAVLALLDELADVI